MRTRTTLRVGALMLLIAVAGASVYLVTHTGPTHRQRTMLLSAGYSLGNANPDAAVSGTGAGWALTTAGLAVTTNGGSTFTIVHPPNPLTTSTDAWVSGSNIDLAGVVQAGTSGPAVELETSLDGGTTWSTSSLPSDGLQPSRAQLIANNAGINGVMVTNETSSAFSSGTFYSTPDGGKTWSAHAAPTGGAVTFADGVLWLVGGPLNDELFNSGNAGITWQEVSVPSAVTANRAALTLVGSTVPGDVLLIATSPGSASSQPSVSVYISVDGGNSWALRAATTLDGNIGRGVGTPTSVQPDGSIWLGAPANSEIVQISTAGQVQAVPSGGLFPSIDAISAAGNGVAWVVASNSSCPNGKTSCSSYSALFMTKDGGRSWTHANFSTRAASA